MHGLTNLEMSLISWTLAAGTEAKQQWAKNLSTQRVSLASTVRQDVQQKDRHHHNTK